MSMVGAGGTNDALHHRRDRDRTCDPYHVKEVRASEIADFIGIDGTKNGGKGRHVPLMFAFSGSLNQRAIPRLRRALPPDFSRPVWLLPGGRIFVICLLDRTKSRRRTGGHCECNDHVCGVAEENPIKRLAMPAEKRIRLLFAEKNARLASSFSDLFPWAMAELRAFGRRVLAPCA
jgi:hypothetical protein